MKTLILANGNGTRMYPLTKYINKNMIPIDGKPIIEYIIGHLLPYSLSQIVIAVGVFKEQIINYFQDGSKWGVDIQYSESDEPQGTAGELAKAKEFFVNEEDFLIYYGDTLTNTDLGKFYEYHKEHNGTITLNGIIGMPIETGIISHNQAGQVIDFQEKPVCPVLSNVPVFYCTNEIFQKTNIQKGKDFSRNVFPTLVKQGKIFTYIEDDSYHYDVGNLNRLDRIIELYKTGQVGNEKTIK